MVSGWVHRLNFFSPHLKGRLPLRLCHRWSINLHTEDPTLEYCTFFFPVLLLLSVFSFIPPTSKALLLESHKNECLTKNAGMLFFALLQRGVFRHRRQSRYSAHISLDILKHIFNRQRRGIFTWLVQTSTQTQNTWLTEASDENDEAYRRTG